MNIITPERLATLEFQATHNGLTPARWASIQKVSGKVDPDLGSMIPITLNELRAFLLAYEVEK